MSTIKKESISKTLGMFLPTLIAIVALAVQWGAVMEKLDSFEKIQNRHTEAFEKTNEVLTKVQKDLSFIKGKIQDK